jgi:Zn-dependent protease with chaperone function
MAFALVFYGNGAAFVESFVNYPSWGLIGAREFSAYHRFIGPRVVAFLVAPALMGTMFTLLLVRFRPRAIPRWSVWVTVVLQVVTWVSTATIQFPIQLQLSAQGFSAPLVECLMETNWWLRRLPYAACAVMFLWMAARAAAPHEPEVRDQREPRSNREP